MWKKQIILYLSILYVRDSFAKSFRPIEFDYNYRVQSHRHSPNRGRSVITTPRPLLQQYWHSFVRNLPTLPPISWNITNPIGNLFNAGAQQVIDKPAAMHYMMEKPNKRKTKTSKRRPSKKSKQRKGSQSRNYYNMFDNSYDNSYQQTQMRLQPLGLDQNRVMHFYEPTSGQYYALQLESQPYYYNSLYGNKYNGQYNNQFSQHNSYSDNGYDDKFAGASSSEDESYYSDDNFDSEHGYGSSEDNYDSDHQHDHEHNRYDSGHSNYDNQYDEDNMEYDDGVQLVDNWGYNDEEIFADRNLKGGSNYYNNIADRLIKIQRHLLKPETKDDVKLLLYKGQKLSNKNERTSTKKEEEKPEVESVRSAFNTFTRMKDDNALNRKKSFSNRKQILRLIENPRAKAKYYIFPANVWL